MSLFLFYRLADRNHGFLVKSPRCFLGSSSPLPHPNIHDNRDIWTSSPLIIIIIMDFDCERTCRSRQHGTWCTAAVVRGTEDEAYAALTRKCRNPGNLVDASGRTVLHAAASCGKRRVVAWLLRCAKAKANAKDAESGYTALHRALYFGQVNCAVELMRHGLVYAFGDFSFLSLEQ
jgi:ankyrin repeat protein